MKKFSYAIEFYNRNWFDLDHPDEFKKAVEIAEQAEKHFLGLTDEQETIRTNILLSYRFKRDLSLEDRINHVRGIIYSRQFLNEEDVFRLFDEFDKKDKKIYEKSLFGIRDFSDEFDYAFYYEYLENYLREDNKKEIEKSPKIQELVKQAKKNYEEMLKEPEKDIAKDKSIKIEDRKKDIYDEYPEEEFEDEELEDESNYKMEDLSLMERFVLSKEYYPVYKEGLLKSKKIRKGTKTYKMVVQGMDDYNSYITNLYEDTYNFLRQEFFKSMKNLTFVI